MTSKTEEWLYKKAKEVDSELELQDLYTSKFSFGGRWVMDLLEEYHKEQLTLTDVVVPKGTLVCDNCKTKLKAQYHTPKGIFCIKCKDLTN
jgi:hypothetical protein